MFFRTFLLLIFFLLTNSIYLLSSTIKADYNIEIKPISEYPNISQNHLDKSILSLLGYYLEVEANYRIDNLMENEILFYKNNSRDEIDEQLKNLIPINNLTVKFFDNRGAEIDSSIIQASCQEDTIKVRLNKQSANFSMICKYSFIGLSLESINETNLNENTLKRNLYIWSGEGLCRKINAFLYCDQHPITNNKLEISTPNSFYTLTSNLIESERLTDKVQRRSEIFPSASDEINDRFSICALDTSIYKRFTLANGSNKVNIYIRYDSLAKFEKYLDNIFPIISEINSFKLSKYDSDSPINIVELDYEKKQGSMGRAFGNLILMDRKFLKYYSSIIHEYLHTQISNPLDNSKGFYVMAESMIEYLAFYFCYHNTPDIYINEINKAQSSYKVSTDSTKFIESLYDLTLNQSGTFDAVYQHGVSLIYDLSQNIGEGEFIKLLMKFYKDHNKTNAYTYDDFIKFLLNNNISKTVIQEFDSKVKKQCYKTKDN
jgi:hypothetical protein